VLLTNENVLEYLGNAFNSNPRLKEKCLRFIEANITELAKFSEFLDLPSEVMAEILKRTTLAAKDELEVFNIIMSWRDHHKEQVISSTTQICTLKKNVGSLFFFSISIERLILHLIYIYTKQ